MKELVSPFSHWMVCFFLFLPLFGCGPKGSSLPTQYVEGVVTLDGSNAEKVLVSFQPTAIDGVAASGYTNEQGVYRLSSVGGDPQKGAITGEYKVTFSKVNIEAAKSSDGSSDDSGGIPKQTETLHGNYLKKETTPHTVNVENGKNTFNFDLTKDGK